MTPYRLFIDDHPKVVSYLRVAVIAVICAIGTTLYNNERTDQRVSQLAQHEAEKRVIAIRAADRKIQEAKDEATRIATEQNTYTNNRLVCVLRTIADSQITRLELTKPKGYKEAEQFWHQIIDNSIPIPNTPETCRNLAPPTP